MTATSRVNSRIGLVGGMSEAARRISQGSNWSAVAECYRALAMTLLSRTAATL